MTNLTRASAVLALLFSCWSGVHFAQADPANSPNAAASDQSAAISAAKLEKNRLARQEIRWHEASREKAFASFYDWTQGYLKAPAGGRPALVPEGLALAQERRQALAKLIQSDPEKALALAVPVGVRQERGRG